MPSSRRSSRGEQEPAGPEDEERQSSSGDDSEEVEEWGSPGQGETDDDEEEEEGEGEEDVEWSGGEGEESDGEEDLYAVLNRAASSAFARQLQQFPLIRDWRPPVMRHELAAELSMRTAAGGPRGEPHPLARRRSVCLPTAEASESSLDSGGGGRRRRASEHDARSPRRRRGGAEAEGADAEPPAPPTPAPSAQRRPLNPRTRCCCGRLGRAVPAGACCLSSAHTLPPSTACPAGRRGWWTSAPLVPTSGSSPPTERSSSPAFQHERKIRMYDVHAGFRLVKDVHARGLQWTVTDTALSSDNRFLLYSSITPEVHLVNVERSGAVESVANVTDIHETLDLAGGRTARMGIWSLQWSADSRDVVAGTSDPGVRVYDMLQGKVVAQVQGHQDDVNAVAYAERGSPNIIFSAVWDRRTVGASGRRCRPAGVFVGHTEGITHIDSKGDGRYLISNSKDQTIKLWDMCMMASEKDAYTLNRAAPSFHWDYRWMEYPGKGRVVQHPNCRAVQTYRGHSVLSTLIRAYWSPAATTGQRFVYTGSFDGRAVVYDAITAQPVARLGGYHRECVRDCSWHPHLPLLATVSFDGACTLWEPDVAGDAQAAAEEAAAFAEAQQPGSAGRGGGGGGRGALPTPLGDQYAW
ncbi:hypothetical protein ABPG77_000280 [Micractinium sp. CCAP 211/92]